MPAIEAIRRHFPSHRIVLLTDRHKNNSNYVSAWDVLSPTGWFDDVLFNDYPRSCSTSHIKLLKLFYKLSSLRPEFIFNLASGRTPTQSLRDRLFFGLINHKAKYHELKPTHGHSIQKTIKLPIMVPEWELLLKSVNGFLNDDLEITPERFTLPIPTEKQEETRSLLSTIGIDHSSPIVALGPGSKMPAKRWPAEYFSELGSKLLRSKSNLHLVIVGGGEEREIGNDLCREWGTRACNLAGKLTIYDSAAVLSRCHCYVGNDTGTMHLAGIAGIRCVSIFSSRDYPGKWEPYGSGHKILRTDPECCLCKLEVCPRDNFCLKQISVEMVFDATMELINS